MAVDQQFGLADVTTDCDAPRGEALSLEEVFRTYARYVGAIALRVLGRPDDVDDLVQEVFVEASQRLSSLRDPGALKGWLATVTVRLAQRHLRRRRRWRLFVPEREYDYAQLGDASASPEDVVALSDLYRVLDRLPPRQRVAWTVRHLEDEPLDRVAEICGCSLATAKRRIAAADGFVRRVMRHG